MHSHFQPIPEVLFSSPHLQTVNVTTSDRTAIALWCHRWSGILAAWSNLFRSPSNKGHCGVSAGRLDRTCTICRSTVSLCCAPWLSAFQAFALRTRLHLLLSCKNDSKSGYAKCDNESWRLQKRLDWGLNPSRLHGNKYLCGFTKSLLWQEVF